VHEGQLGVGTPARAASEVSRGEVVIAPARVDLASRVARLLDLQEHAATRPVSHMTLRLDNAAGGEDRIRVDLRGLSVGATIDLSDPAAADRVSARIAELQRALERQGLETESLRVRSAAHLTDTVELSRVATTLHEGDAQRIATLTTSNSSSPASRERGGSSTSQDDPRRGSDASRHRSRREPKGENHK
jgi:hypothetical protein